MHIFPGPFRHLTGDVVSDLVIAVLVALAASLPPAFWTVSGMPSETVCRRPRPHMAFHPGGARLAHRFDGRAGLAAALEEAQHFPPP